MYLICEKCMDMSEKQPSEEKYNAHNVIPVWRTISIIRDRNSLKSAFDMLLRILHSLSIIVLKHDDDEEEDAEDVLSYIKEPEESGHMMILQDWSVVV